MAVREVKTHWMVAAEESERKPHGGRPVSMGWDRLHWENNQVSDRRPINYIDNLLLIIVGLYDLWALIGWSIRYVTG